MRPESVKQGMVKENGGNATICTHIAHGLRGTALLRLGAPNWGDVDGGRFRLSTLLYTNSFPSVKRSQRVLLCGLDRNLMIWYSLSLLPNTVD